MGFLNHYVGLPHEKAFSYYLPPLPICNSTASTTLAKGPAGTALITRLVKADNVRCLLSKTEEAIPNLTDGAIEVLATGAASFDALRTAPQLTIDGAKTKGVTTTPPLSARNAFLRHAPRAGMAPLKDMYADVYQVLRKASPMHDAGCRKRDKNTHARSQPI